MLKELLEQLFDRASEYCANPENRVKLHDKLLAPILEHLAVRFQWLFNCLQALAALLIIQTLLLVWILVTVRRRAS
jgi:hypothetical protein